VQRPTGESIPRIGAYPDAALGRADRDCLAAPIREANARRRAPSRVHGRSPRSGPLALAWLLSSANDSPRCAERRMWRATAFALWASHTADRFGDDRGSGRSRAAAPDYCIGFEPGVARRSR